MAKLECFEAGLAKITGRFQEVDLYRVRAELEHAIEQNASKALTVDLEGLESVSSAILSMLLCGVSVCVVGIGGAVALTRVLVLVLV